MKTPKLERIDPKTMHLRIGLFTAETGDTSIDVANSGGSLIIHVESKKWEAKHKGQITPFRYKLTPQTICDMAMDAYEEQVKELDKE